MPFPQPPGTLPDQEDVPSVDERRAAEQAALDASKAASVVIPAGEGGIPDGVQYGDEPASGVNREKWGRSEEGGWRVIGQARRLAK